MKLVEVFIWIAIAACVVINIMQGMDRKNLEERVEFLEEKACYTELDRYHTRLALDAYGISVGAFEEARENDYCRRTK